MVLMRASGGFWAVASSSLVAVAVAAGGACGDDAAEDATASSTAGAGTEAAGTEAAGTGGSSPGSGGAGAVGGGSSVSTYSSSVGGTPTHESPCGTDKIYECGDLEDNDSDGFIDWQDTDCLGPCDNTEDSYHADIPGDLSATCRVDCYWDNGNGSGTDECYWDHRCDELAVGPDFPPQGEACAYEPDDAQLGPLGDCDTAFTSQGDTCLNVCGTLTPNGCDCFGCCELPAGGGEYVWLGSEVDNEGSCTQADVGDTSKCKPCTPVQGCLNDCAPCELCIGKPEPSDDCGGGEGGGSTGVTVGAGGGDPGQQCPDGVVPCGLEGQAECEVGEYCITGCCRVIPQ
jgi:hypothetical protein